MTDKTTTVATEASSALPLASGTSLVTPGDSNGASKQTSQEERDSAAVKDTCQYIAQVFKNFSENCDTYDVQTQHYVQDLKDQLRAVLLTDHPSGRVLLKNDEPANPHLHGEELVGGSANSVHPTSRAIASKVSSNKHISIKATPTPVSTAGIANRDTASLRFSRSTRTSKYEED